MDTRESLSRLRDECYFRFISALTFNTFSSSVCMYILIMLRSSSLRGNVSRIGEASVSADHELKKSYPRNQNQVHCKPTPRVLSLLINRICPLGSRP